LAASLPIGASVVANPTMVVVRFSIYANRTIIGHFANDIRTKAISFITALDVKTI